MKKLIVTTAALMLLTAAPAMAMSCGGKSRMMCGKPGAAMGHGSMKKSKGCCCGENMSMNMSKRR